MQYQPIITKTAVILDLHKPIYESHFGVWDKWLLIARDRSLNIIVKTPFGTSTYTYSSYMSGAGRMERYYKNPDEPMIFYGRSVMSDVLKRDKRKKIEKKLNRDYNRDYSLKGREMLLKAWREVQGSV